MTGRAAKTIFCICCLFWGASTGYAAYQTWTNDVWTLDNNGKPIMAQGGGISKFGSTYYWYGVQYAEMGPYYTNGTVNTSSSTFVAINCYSSSDLVHWIFQNQVVNKSTSGFSNPGWVGRMGQVAYNSANNQYVMWFEGLGGQACCTCSTPTGNFVLNHVQNTITNVYYGPGAGDCTIFCDVDHGGTPYFICSDPHGRQHAYICPLSLNYLIIGDAVAINDIGSIPAWPQGQEADNMFERNGVYYYTMSNLAGWSFSSAYEVSSTNIFSPTSYTADATYLGTTTDFTHHSQVSFGFQVAGTQATNYIMVGDRWAQFINTYENAGPGDGKGFSIMCPITFTNGTPYFNSESMFQVDAVTGKIRPAIPADVPSNFVASATQGQASPGVELSWATMDGATAYNVYRSTTNGGPYALIASPAATTLVDTGVQNGTTYYYVVTSTNSFGESPDSIQVNATPSIGPLITTASVSPSPVYPAGALAISATVAAQVNPVASVTVNVSALGGATNQALIPDGAGDYTNAITVGAATLDGAQPLTINAVDSLGNSASPYFFSAIVGSLEFIWNGSGPDENWSDGANWVGGAAPGPGSALDFTGVNNVAPVLDNSYNTYAVLFDNNAGTFSIGSTGSSILTITGGVTNNSAHSQTLNVPVVLGAPVTINAASAGLTLGQTINLGANLLTITNNGYNTIADGAISGSGGLSCFGTGTNILLGINTFTGNLSLSNVTLLVSGSGQLDNAAYSGTIADNGTLAFGGIASQTLSGNISGSGALNQIGAGQLTLANANTFTGPTTVTAGTLSIANTLALQNSTLNFNSGKVNFNGITSATLGGLAGSQNLDLINNSLTAVALTVGSNNVSTTFSGSLSGSGSSLTKIGTGTLTLTGANNYSGSTIVNAGTLELTNGGTITGGTLGGAGFLVDGGTLISSGTTSFSPASNTFLESSGAANFGAVTEPNNDGLLIEITGGTFSTTSLTLQRTAQFLTAPSATSPIAAATTSGLYVNGSSAVVDLGSLTIGTGNSSDSGRLDAGTMVITNEVLVGHTSNSRWEILQVNGGTFTSLDTLNGIVLSQNNGSTSNNSELYISGGTMTAGKVVFGANTDTVGNSGFLIINGGNLFLGSGGIVLSNSTSHYTSTISLMSGMIGAATNWSSSLPMQLNGTFTIQAADSSGVPHNITLNGPLPVRVVC